MKRAPHLGMTEKEFRRLKRKQYHAALQALDDLVTGSGYTPNGGEIGKAVAELNKLGVRLRKWWKGY
jgi:hypothetical protein